MKRTTTHEDIFVKYPELKEAMGTYDTEKIPNKKWTDIQLEMMRRCYKYVSNKTLLEYLQKEEKKGRTITIMMVYNAVRNMKQMKKWRDEK